LSGGNFVNNTGFEVSSSGIELGKFSFNAEVLDIGKKDVVWDCLG